VGDTAINRTYLLLVFLCLANPLIAHNLTLTLESETNEVILGLPLKLKATIRGDKPFVLPGTFGIDCNQYGGVFVTDKSGNRVGFSSGAPCPQFVEEQFPSESKAQYPNQGEAIVEIFLPAGSYDVQAYYHSAGPFIDRYSDKDQRIVEGIWEGHARSNVVSVQVKIPDGDDRNALLNLGPASNGSAEDYAMFILTHRKELLKNYPTSTYTTELILQYVDTPEDSEPKKIKELIDAGLYPRGNVVPDPDSPSGFSPTLPSRMRAQWYVEHLPALIKKYPFQAKMESLRLALGLSYLVLGNRTEADKLLQEVARLNTKRGDWAKNFIIQSQEP
jgi:hypothetical protein